MTPDPASPGSRVVQRLRASLAHATRKGGFVRHVATLMTGTVGTQVLYLALAPVLTRFYTPVDFAVFTLYAAGANLLTAVASGRYEFAVALPERDEDGMNLLIIGLVLSVLSGLAGGAALWWFRDPLASSVGDGLDSRWMLGIPVAAVVYSWADFGARWLQRKRRFAAMARCELIAAVATLGFQIGVPALSSRADGLTLVLGQLLGRTVAFGLSGLDLLRDGRPLRPGLRLARMGRLALEYWRFPVIATPASLLGKATNEVPRLLLGRYHPPAVLGHYSLANRIVSAPLALLGTAVGNVFFSRVGELVRSGRLTRAYMTRAAVVMLVISLPPAVVLFFWAEPIFAWVFGAQWTTAGTYLVYLLPMLISRFVVAPFGLALQALGRQSFVIVWQAVCLGVSVAVFRPGFIDGDITRTLLTYSLAMAGLYGFYMAAIVFYAGSPPKARAHPEAGSSEPVA